VCFVAKRGVVQHGQDGAKEPSTTAPLKLLHYNFLHTCSDLLMMMSVICCCVDEDYPCFVLLLRTDDDDDNDEDAYEKFFHMGVTTRLCLRTLDKLALLWLADCKIN